mmetsp:Transcript_60948/g.108289  ORF Transcript_60948/g.108289 Transcript_60948/m.108289 type:complete len:300 (+) Transcript_60948:295-1194(+)
MLTLRKCTLLQLPFQDQRPASTCLPLALHALLLRAISPESQYNAVCFLFCEKNVLWRCRAFAAVDGQSCQSFPPFFRVEDSLAQQSRDGAVGDVGPRELLIQQATETSERKVPPASCSSERARADAAPLRVPLDEPRKAAALSAHLRVEGELREWRRENLDRNCGLRVREVRQVMHAYRTLLHDAGRAFGKLLLPLDVAFPGEESGSVLLVCEFAMHDLHPHLPTTAHRVGRHFLPWAPACHDDGEVIIAMYDVLHRVELAKMGRTRVRCPFHGCHFRRHQGVENSVIHVLSSFQRGQS